ncbi:Cytochrome c-type biogenesis protein CycK [Nymphon striatum]|nr:Cytochrome c-type biogenesis protein CycK [Nymphon striatum]
MLDRIRLGGLVVEGSVDSSAGNEVKFAIEDVNHAITVKYEGILPDLFREGQGIVAEAKRTRLLERRRTTMIVEIGHFSLVLALALALAQVIVPFAGLKNNDTRFIAVAPSISIVVFAVIAISFGALTWAYVVSDFSVKNVWENSFSSMPLLYKFTGVWGNHEGSMLLWVLILALFGALVAAFGGNLPARLRAAVLATQGTITVAFTAFLLLTSNPFIRLSPAPFEGRGFESNSTRYWFGNTSAAPIFGLCVLTSVHSFANDPTRGLFILAILVLFIGGALFLFALRVSKLKTGGMFHPISREGALVLNNLFLTTAAATVFVGTLYPLFIEALVGEKISVGEPYFNMTFGPLMVPLLIAIPFGPFLAWKRGNMYGAFERLWVAAGLALLVALIFAYVLYNAPILASFGIALALWLIFGAIADLWAKAGLPKTSPSVAWARLKGLQRSSWGTALAHAGVGVTTLGIVWVTTFESETVLKMAPGDTTVFAGYDMRFDSLEARDGPNYFFDEGVFSVSKNGKPIGKVVSEKRIYLASRTPTTEAGILTQVFSQFYVSLGEKIENSNQVVVRIWWKPMILLIWIGTILMTLGGVVSLSDRRLRIGAPQTSKNKIRQKIVSEVGQ